MYTVLLKGAPISYILLLLLTYVVGAFLYIFVFFKKHYLSRQFYSHLEKQSVTIQTAEIIAEEATYAFISGMSGIDKHLQFLKLIVNLAPLLGLLGTVLGLVRSTSGLVLENHNELLLGISQSLITTAMGLIVSIPALLVHFYGKAKQDKVIFQAKQYLVKRVEF